MPSTRKQKAKARKSREMDMMSDFGNLDVMMGNDNNNPIERELVDAIEQPSVHEDANTNTYHRNEYGNLTYENDSVRQNDVRQSFEALSNEFNLRLSQEMDSMMSMTHSQINRAITTAIAQRVIPEIQNIATQCRPQVTGTLRTVCPLIVKKTGKTYRGPKRRSLKRTQGP